MVKVDRWGLFKNLFRYYSTSLFNIERKNDNIYDIFDRLKKASIYATLPRAGSPISLQSATYFDGTYLHVWYGSSPTGNSAEEEIYYTRAAKPFTEWTTPKVVIHRPTGWGIRDPTSLVTKDYVYLFIQAFDGTMFRSMRLYKVPRTADFSDPASYTYVGVIYDRGGAGEFDGVWAASPTPINIGGLTIVLYEAMDAGGNYTIGILYSEDIEKIPYTRLGTLNSLAGTPIRNPTATNRAIVPCNWLSPNCFFMHYRDETGWHIGAVVGDVFANRFALVYPLDPSDGHVGHNNVAVVGIIDDYLYLLMQAWTTWPPDLRLYRIPVSDLL